MTFDLSTAAGIAAATAILVQILLTASGLPDAMQNRWGPLVALAVGVVLAILNLVVVTAGPLTGPEIVNAILLGLGAGASAMGIHNLVTKSVVGSAAAGALGVPTTDSAPQG